MNLLSLYVCRTAFQMFALVALALTGLLSLFDFVEQLATVGQGRYRVIDALVYIVLTSPSRLLQVAPIAVLLATLLVLGRLSAKSEYIAMMSLGVSERRIIQPLLWLVPPITAVLFLVAQFIIPAAQQLAQTERTAALSSSVQFHAEDSLWAQSDLQYLNVQQFGRGDVPIGIDIYNFSLDGTLDSIVHAERAMIRKDGTWLLDGVTRKRAHDFSFIADHPPSLVWRSFLAPQQVRYLFLPIESMPPLALLSYIRSMHQRHQNVPRYERELWHKISIPASMLAMILIGAPFASGPPRTHTSGRNLTFGVGLALIFSLSQQIIDHLGLLLGVSPPVAALLPPVLVISVIIALFARRAGAATEALQS